MLALIFGSLTQLRPPYDRDNGQPARAASGRRLRGRTASPIPELWDASEAVDVEAALKRLAWYGPTRSARCVASMILRVGEGVGQPLGETQEWVRPFHRERSSAHPRLPAERGPFCVTSA